MTIKRAGDIVGKRAVLLAVGIVAAGLTLTARADAPAAPIVTTVAYVNGKMNLAVWYKTGVYGDRNGANLSYAYEIGMKGAGEADWADVTAKGAFNTYEKNNYRFRCWTMATNYFGAAEYRIRAKDTSTSETSDWVELGAVSATMNVTGTPIYGNNCNGNGFDGYIHTMVDATTDSGDNKYVGYLFPEPTRIKAIRYLPRLDHMTLAARYRNSLFQIASDETFSDAETVHTVPSGFSSITGMTEVVFEEPITAKAIRHYKQYGGFESTAEIEFIPADFPFKPSLAIAYSDFTNFHPVVTWSLPAEFMCTTCRLERALHKDGPWTAQSAWLDPAVDSLCVTNDDLYVGIPCYYRVAAVTEHPGFAGQCAYSRISEYTRMRRIDRAWTDEAHLYGGVSVLVGTNGSPLTVVGGRTAPHVFDGNPETFADLTQEWNKWGPIGLDFGENVWVGAFGYVCRHDNACYYRIKYTALFSSSDSGNELGDRVQHSQNVTRYSQDATFYMQTATSIPADGARKWFLYGTYHDDNYFYGNVAELAFFGWTAADKAAAPVVSAPAQLTFVRGATGPVVSWTAGNHAQGYVVRRRARGDSQWADVATLPASSLTFTDEGLAQGVYEYSVVADGGELGTAASDAFTYPWYTAGNGTGLSGAVMWPYSSTNMIPWQMSSSAPRGVEAVNLNLGGADEVAPGVVAHARIAWEGQLIVPFDGLYTFTLETDAGGAVAIDDVFACNSWTGGTKIPSGTMNLTAGVHDIRVDYRMDDRIANPTKKCILSWSGPVADEVIPASQLIPAATPPSPTLDGWTCLSYAMNRVGRFVKTGEGTYKVTASAQEMGTPDRFNTAFMWKRMPSSFAIETKVQRGNADGYAGIMVQGDDGHFVASYMYVLAANSAYGVKRFVPGNDTWDQPVLREQFGNNSNFDCYLRMEKRGPDITCLWKDNKGDPWVEIYRTAAPHGMFGQEVAVGLAVNGFNSSNPPQFIFSEIELKAINVPTIIIIR